MIADSSALSAFFLNEETRPKIESLLFSELRVLTLDFAMIEILNAVWKRCHSKKLSSKQATAIKSELERATNQYLFEVVPSKPYYARSLRLSIKHDVPIYDSLFIASCLLRHDRILSLDERQKEISRLEGIKPIEL